MAQWNNKLHQDFFDEIPTSSCNFAQTHNWQQHEVTTFLINGLVLTPTRDVFTFLHSFLKRSKQKYHNNQPRSLSKNH